MLALEEAEERRIDELDGIQDEMNELMTEEADTRAMIETYKTQNKTADDETKVANMEAMSGLRDDLEDMNTRREELQQQIDDALDRHQIERNDERE